MANGKNTEPRYEILLAHNATSRLGETDNRVYPTFTTNTEENSKVSHTFFFFTNNKYPINNNSDIVATTPYMMDWLAAFSPT